MASLAKKRVVGKRNLRKASFRPLKLTKKEEVVLKTEFNTYTIKPMKAGRWAVLVYLQGPELGYRRVWSDNFPTKHAAASYAIERARLQGGAGRREIREAKVHYALP